MLVFKGGWWWCLQITTTLENEHTCSCLRVVGGGSGGKPRVVMVGDGKTTTLENERTRTLVLEGVVAEGGGAVAVVAVVLLIGSGCRHPCPCWWCSRLLSMRHWQLLSSLSSVLCCVHIETCGCHCCQ